LHLHHAIEKTALPAVDDPAQTWVMVSDRQGDRVQAETIARATRLRYVVKYVVPQGGSRKNRPSRTHTPDRLDSAHSSCLAPPWPRLIIAVGHWAVRAALWVQEQSNATTRLVLVGRPRPREFHRFDLIIVSSHYVVPPHARVIHLGLPPYGPIPSSSNANRKFGEID
jgi:mitochondrial fission protein ELM1